MFVSQILHIGRGIFSEIPDTYFFFFILLAKEDIRGKDRFFRE